MEKEKKSKAIDKRIKMDKMQSALDRRHGIFAMRTQKQIWGCISVDGVTSSGRHHMLELLGLKATDWNGFKLNFLNLILASLYKSGYLLDFSKEDLLYYKKKRGQYPHPTIVYEDPAEPK